MANQFEKGDGEEQYTALPAWVVALFVGFFVLVMVINAFRPENPLHKALAAICAESFLGQQLGENDMLMSIAKDCVES